MDTKDPYPWLESDDPRRFQTDREILELAVDLSQSCLTKTQQVEFMDVLEKYKEHFVCVMKLDWHPIWKYT